PSSSLFLRVRWPRTRRRRAVPYSERLLVAVDDAAAGQVVRAQVHDHPILWEDADVVLTHLARDVGKHLVSVGELDSKHRIRQCLDDRALDLDDAVLFRHSLTVACYRTARWSCGEMVGHAC